MNSFNKISAVIIVKDAEQTIGQTLESLKGLVEVVIYDNGSTDKTLEIAKRYNNVKIVLGRFTGFGDTKNTAADFAKNDWILSIDSDEVLSSKLYNSIDELNLNDKEVYWFYRYNYYRKKRVKYSGWGKEKVARLYNKKVTHFNSRLVHEGLEISRNLRAVKLDGEIMHHSYMSVADFNKKRALYSDLFAIENQGTRKSSPLLALISGTFAFFYTFLIRLAIFDGYRGLLISVSNAHETFLKHLKLYEANLENSFKVSLIVTSSANMHILEMSLKSILEQSISPNEIIIIENNAVSELKEAIERFAKTSFIKVTIINNNNNNIAELRNRAIAKAKHEYLIFVDGNSILHASFVKDHITFAKKGVYLQGEIERLKKNISEKIIKDKNFQASYIKTACFGPRSKLHIILASIIGFFRQKKPLAYRLNNFSIFKKELEKLNGFNEDLTQLKHCDADLLERLYIAKVKRRTLRFISTMYRLVGTGTGMFEKLKLNFKPNKPSRCNNGLDKYPVEKQEIKRIV